jgi:hypothetical protein
VPPRARGNPARGHGGAFLKNARSAGNEVS